MNPYPTDQEDELWLIEEGKGENGRNIASLAVYQICMKVGEVVWKEVDAWPFFAKDTIGKQIVKSSDSIAANLAEGHGRYSFKENLRFCFYARGSLVETQTWLQKANNRDLLSESTFHQLRDQLTHAHKMINGYIRYIRRNIQASS